MLARARPIFASSRQVSTPNTAETMDTHGAPRSVHSALNATATTIRAIAGTLIALASSVTPAISRGEAPTTANRRGSSWSSTPPTRTVTKNRG
jgi:hypothetical protein